MTATSRRILMARGSEPSSARRRLFRRPQAASTFTSTLTMCLATLCLAAQVSWALPSAPGSSRSPAQAVHPTNAMSGQGRFHGGSHGVSMGYHRGFSGGGFADHRVYAGRHYGRYDDRRGYGFRSYPSRTYYRRPYGYGYGFGYSYGYGGPYYRPSYFLSLAYDRPYFALGYGYPYGAGAGVYASAPPASSAPERISPGMGAIDVNVKPKAAEVWVDGRYYGIVDDFDGFPRYLWLSEGERQITIYHEGYVTLVEQVSVDRDRVFNWKAQMEPGMETPPHDSGPVEEDSYRVGSPSPARPPVARGPAPPEPAPEDLRQAPAHLRFVVSPIDAVVYLDGRLLGSGDDLARLHAPLIVDPGVHLLQVVRPGYRTEEVRFGAESGEEIELETLLSEESLRGR